MKCINYPQKNKQNNKTLGHIKAEDIEKKKICIILWFLLYSLNCQQNIKQNNKIAVARVTVWRSIIVFLYSFSHLSSCSPQKFSKKKCVSIDAKWSEAHRNEKKNGLWVAFPFAAECSIFKKKSVSQSTRIALKRIEKQKNIFYPFDALRALRVAQSPSGVAQWNFNTINRT